MNKNIVGTSSLLFFVSLPLSLFFSLTHIRCVRHREIKQVCCRWLHKKYLSTWRDVSRGKPAPTHLSIQWLKRVFFAVVVACKLCVFVELVGRVKHIIYTRSGNNDDAMPPPILAKWVPRLSLCFLHSVRILQFHLKIAPFIFSAALLVFLLALSCTHSLTHTVLLRLFSFGCFASVTHSIYLCVTVWIVVVMFARAFKFPTGIEVLYEISVRQIHRSSGISISKLITSRIAVDTYHDEIKTFATLNERPNKRTNGRSNEWMNGFAQFFSDFVQLHIFQLLFWSTSIQIETPYEWTR